MSALIKSIIIFLLFACISSNPAIADDSIQQIQLQEVEVSGERSWISNDGTLNYIPSKGEKRLSNSPASLIESMHTPILRSNGETIETNAGEPLTIFINGERATDIDIATFWPNEVMTVQYMENPKDPSFEGERHVVNFITRKYSAGGVCRTNASQKIPNGGYYTSSAKVAYRKMTFGAMFQGIYSRDHRVSTTGETSYNNLFYNNSHYDEIHQYENSRSYERHDIINSAINARYTGDSFHSTHTLTLSWLRYPGSGSTSTDIWTDNLFKSNRSFSENRSRTISPQVSGKYYKHFSDKWHLDWSWNYIYADRSAYSESQTGESALISNGSKERINTLKLNLAPWFILSKKIFFQMNTRTRLDWFSTDYSGSADIRQRQRRNQSSAGISVGWTPVNNFWLSVQPGIGMDRWDIGDIHENAIYPTAYAQISWTMSRKASIWATLQFKSTPPSASESNPVLLRNSELLWTEGNPYLRQRSDWDAYLSANYLASDNLSFSLNIGYDRSENSFIYSYEQAFPELGGLIRRNMNSVPSQGIRVHLPVSWTLMNRKISFRVTPRWRHSHIVGGEYGCRFNHFSVSASADYTHGFCRFGLSYDSPYKDLLSAGMEKTRTDGYFNFNFTYGTGNLHVSADIENLFHDKAKKWRQFSSEHFNTTKTTLTTGRAIKLSLTYTFGFGRKTDKGIDISGPETVISSVPANE